MLEKIKKKIKLFGAVRVASDLGYRSTVAIQKWIVANKIPETAKERVKEYLKESKK